MGLAFNTQPPASPQTACWRPDDSSARLPHVSSSSSTSEDTEARLLRTHTHNYTTTERCQRRSDKAVWKFLFFFLLLLPFHHHCNCNLHTEEMELIFEVLRWTRVEITIDCNSDLHTVECFPLTRVHSSRVWSDYVTVFRVSSNPGQFRTHKHALLRVHWTRWIKLNFQSNRISIRVEKRQASFFFLQFEENTHGGNFLQVLNVCWATFARLESEDRQQILTIVCL